MVYVMKDGKWIDAHWDKSKVGVYIWDAVDQEWFWYNMACFEAYCFE